MIRHFTGTSISEFVTAPNKDSFVELAETTNLGELLNERASIVRELDERTLEAWEKFDMANESFLNEKEYRRGRISLLENESYAVDKLNSEHQRVKLGKDSQGLSSSTYLIHTNINRFGPILLILFLVALFVRLYRYFIRLALFFQSKVDAMRLSPTNDPETLLKYGEIFSPDHHDIGRPPNLSPTQAMNLVKTAFNDEK